MLEQSTFVPRRRLATLALCLAVIKALQFAADSTPLFFYDSGSFILNGLGLAFIPERSYLYSFLIRPICLPFSSLTPLIVAQVLIGGFTAWLAAFTLVRFFRVRFWIAAVASLIFAFDPKQIVHERMVMTENLALLVAVLFLLAALQYIRVRSLPWLVLVSFLGTLLAGVRIAYLPVVLVCSISLPVVAHFRRPTASPRALAFGLAMACAATLLFHGAYRALTGHLAGREPAYVYTSGHFLAATAAPIITPADTDDPIVAAVVRRQETSDIPLNDPVQRGNQRWDLKGLIAQLTRALREDPIAVDAAATGLAHRAIQRNPLGFLRLAFSTYWEYWRRVPWANWSLEIEQGIGPKSQVNAWDRQVTLSRYNFDATNNHRLRTLSRRYHARAYPWTLFLLLAPFLGLAAIWFVPADRRIEAGFLAGWNCLVMAALCVFSGEAVYRYLHPFSFTGLLATALLAEAVVRRGNVVRRRGSES